MKLETILDIKKFVAEAYKHYKLVKSKYEKGEATKDKVSIARRGIEQRVLVVYSIPKFREYVVPWMIDIKYGTENPFYSGNDIETDLRDAEEELKSLIENPEGFTEYHGGSLLQNIQNFLVKKGFVITDRGSGFGGGHIGIPCSDQMKDELIDLMYKYFGKAIERGLIFPKIVWFAPKLMWFMGDYYIDEWIKNGEVE